MIIIFIEQVITCNNDLITVIFILHFYVLLTLVQNVGLLPGTSLLKNKQKQELSSNNHNNT